MSPDLGTLSDDEVRVLHFVADRFELGPNTWFETANVNEELGMDHPALLAVVSRLATFGVLQTGSRGPDGTSVRPLPGSVELRRRLEQIAATKPDLVESLKKWAQQHWFWAGLIITVLVVGVVANVANQVWDLIERIRASFTP